VTGLFFILILTSSLGDRDSASFCSERPRRIPFFCGPARERYSEMDPPIPSYSRCGECVCLSSFTNFTPQCPPALLVRGPFSSIWLSWFVRLFHRHPQNIRRSSLYPLDPSPGHAHSRAPTYPPFRQSLYFPNPAPRYLGFWPSILRPFL